MTFPMTPPHRTKLVPPFQPQLGVCTEQIGRLEAANCGCVHASQHITKMTEFQVVPES